MLDSCISIYVYENFLECEYFKGILVLENMRALSEYALNRLMHVSQAQTSIFKFPEMLYLYLLVKTNFLKFLKFSYIQTFYKLWSALWRYIFTCFLRSLRVLTLLLKILKFPILVPILVITNFIYFFEISIKGNGAILQVLNFFFRTCI